MTLKWSAPKGAKPARYVVLRDGKSLAKVSRTSYTDRKVKAGKTYRYAVRAVDAKGKLGALSASVRVKVPKAAVHPGPTNNPAPPIAAVAPAPLAGGPSPAPAPAPIPPEQLPLTQAMVDRLFWRAGFGPPTAVAERTSWVDKQVQELVDWFLSTPVVLAPTDKPPLTTAGAPIDPNVSDVELELEWIDKMQRAVNPFPHRLAFFWHRHWAISREDGAIPYKFMLAYRDRLLRYAELATSAGATFKQLALEMSTADAAMSMYLNMNQNVRGKPNENYAREFMELFCLGPTGPDGTPNYSQDDVAGLAKAFTGWSLNTTTGAITFGPTRYELPAKTFLGLTQPTVTQTQANAPGFGLARITEAIDRVLAQPNHAQFLIRKLWAEFIASPIPQDTLDGLVASYRAGGYQLRPLLRSILTHPLIFESIDEPNLVKPPIVALVGALRALQAPLRGNTIEQAMIDMQQRIYNPPNVAGWEGGMSWLNTNTVQGRFSMILKLFALKYDKTYDGANTHPAEKYGDDVAGAWNEAYAAANSPWVSAATAAAIKAYGGGLAGGSVVQKRGRFYAMLALILGGPDGQVM